MVGQCQVAEYTGQWIYMRHKFYLRGIQPPRGKAPIQSRRIGYRAGFRRGDRMSRTTSLMKLLSLVAPRGIQ